MDISFQLFIAGWLLFKKRIDWIVKKHRDAKRLKTNQKSSYFLVFLNQLFHSDETKPKEAILKPKQYGSPMFKCGQETKTSRIYTVCQAWASVIKH